VSAFVLVVHLQIKPGAVDRFMPLALENAEATRETEPGCRQFDVMVDPQDATRILFCEVYDKRGGLPGAPADSALQEVLRHRAAVS